MATVSQVNPIWAYFNVSESAFLGVSSRIEGIISGKVNRDSLASTPIKFIQANDAPYPEKGRFVYVNRQVGTQTGTIQMAAEFANPDAALRPGPQIPVLPVFEAQNKVVSQTLPRCEDVKSSTCELT